MRRPATLAASWSAVRTTLVGSITPALTRFFVDPEYKAGVIDPTKVVRTALQDTAGAPCPLDHHRSGGQRGAEGRGSFRRSFFGGGMGHQGGVDF